MLRRTRISRLDVDSWREVAQAAPALPPGAAPGFLEAVASALENAHGEALLLERGQGRLALPVVNWAGMGLAMPFGMPGGPVALEGEPWPLDPDRVRRALGVQKLIAVIHHTRVGDYSSATAASTPKTHLIALDGSDPRTGYRQRARRKLRAAERAGINVRKGGADEADALIEILMAAVADAGRELYPAAEVIRAVAAADEAVILFATTPEGRDVSVALFIDSPLELFYWLGGTLPDAAELSPSYPLIDAAARLAGERRRRWLNLGASEGVPGVAHFKRGFGAEEAGYLTFESVQSV